MAFVNPIRSREYRTEWKRKKYNSERERLIKTMGGKCALCPDTDNLEFDHVGGWRNWNLTQGKIDCLSRLKRYFEEYNSFISGTGKPVRLLCKSCNLKEMNKRKWGGN